jgi:hypothetical protein
MALSTRELAAFVQKVAKLQPQDPPVYGSPRAYNGCTSCVTPLSGLGMGDLSAVPWMWVVPSVLVGAGAMHLLKKSRFGTMLRKRAKKAKKARRSRRSRRRR